ncbi:hypothetical protein [Pseudovibrio sp. SPO723]|uniref:hypothetical protein n=1 Tax=Nesiotobacter zosterae TaxID=392721 RepID=UPI0029C1E896|nr:hypothetical protein [Pseudovibrio sp. SPO723]MDX5592546.1 hypothetical protein [Pseudovibrio sp. SPO723]
MPVENENANVPRTPVEQIDELSAIVIHLLSLLTDDQIEQLKQVEIPLVVREGRPSRFVKLADYLPPKSEGADA